VTGTDKDTQPTLSAARPEMSGLEFWRQMMLGRVSPPPLVALLGLRILEVGEGRVVFAGTAQEQFYERVCSLQHTGPRRGSDD
jgi:hypothetical protein